MLFDCFLLAKSEPYDLIIKKFEQKYRIPKGLLKAIMKVESQGHPFAIYSNKRGGKKSSVMLKGADKAVEYVKSLQRLGVKNINVGCMQINLKCHQAEDISLWFSPEYNIEYAARFLKDLRQRMGSWKKAVAYYHSGTKKQFHARYLNKVNGYLTSANLLEI